MKIEIKNFGPIDYLEFDLEKDLHLIYGYNAIGKSYSTYCLYCVLKSLKESLSKFIDSEKLDKFVRIRTNRLNTANSISILQDYELIIENFLSNTLKKSLQVSLSNTFSSLYNLKNQISNLNYQINLKLDENERIRLSSQEDGNLFIEYKSGISKLEINRAEKNVSQFFLLENENKLIIQVAN